ncbi:WAT1-related protein [Vigna unguiculata]|uniref:WAT1-related protein n=1 Tax=Vigna unguiculata TaxID=3917 RepID=A0A4D6MAF0_VIGUN|nr:WAT1-related protein [Vigna unguiculata]QCD98380.1 WAT1-related protein [Vigna unguiculata]
MAMASGLVSVVLMIMVQLLIAVVNITSRLAIDSGMSPLILVTYRQFFATEDTSQVDKGAYVSDITIVLDRIYRKPDAILCGAKIFNPYNCMCSVQYAASFHFYPGSYLQTRESRNQAEVWASKGIRDNIVWQSSIHWRYAEKIEGTTASGSGNMFVGPLFLIGSTLVWALWFIIQKFPAPYTSTGLMCFLASFQCMFIALCFDHSASAWSLHDAMRLSAALYAGIMATGLSYSLMSWAIERKGPLYVSVFIPLQLVLTAVLSWALLREKLYVGTALGSLLIVLGLYTLLWGKSEEVSTEDGNERSNEGFEE